MLQTMGREEDRYLSTNDIENFPCADLRKIDQLWVKYSKGKFGFSVQKKIYQSLGGTKEYDRKVLETFGDKVGWRKGGEWLMWEELTFRLDHYEGHLPLRLDSPGDWIYFSLPRHNIYSSLAQRLVDCNI